MVHVGLPVRIDPRQERRDFREVGEILPPQRDARRGRHRHQVDGEIGRAAGRVQPDDAVDDRAFVDDAPDRRELIAERGDRQRPLDAEHGERVAQRRVGIDEGRARQMQAHDLHQHLIGVGGAVESAGAGRVIGLGLRLEQVVAGRLAFGEELADFRFLVVGEARGHRSRGQEHRRQMAKREGADQEAGHDLVADAEIDRRIEHVVRKRDRRRERDDVAGEQGKLHPLLALGNPIAHRRNAARDLRRPAHGARRLLDEIGKAGVGLMGREHVIVGGDDREIGAGPLAQRLLVARCAGGEAMGEIGAAEAFAGRLVGDGGVDPREVSLARRAAALDDAFGHLADACIELCRHARIASSIGPGWPSTPSSAKTGNKKGGARGNSCSRTAPPR